MDFYLSISQPLYTLGIFSSIILLYVTCVFIFAQMKKDNSVMDICYGPGFAVAAWSTWYVSGSENQFVLFALLLLTLWATRLSLRILKKNWGKPEDIRYAKWRTEWSAHGVWYFIVRSYIQINLLQGMVIVAVSAPLILLMSTTSSTISLPLIIVGAIVFAAGLCLEVVADWQLDNFIQRKKSGVETAPLMTSGLFTYSRRPNYFGESLIWWGFAIMALSVPYGVIGLISPLVITFILTKVTGPMLEEIFLQKYPDEYRAYMEQTSYFIPWFPKKL